MTKYSEELKANLVARMLAPDNTSVPELAEETGIPKGTLYTWRIKARGSAVAAVPQEAPSAEPGSEEKFSVVLETAAMNEVELSEYCRSKGLYPQRIGAWRAACEQANASVLAKADRDRLRKQSKEIKQLEAELRRKEKALAEAAALLILKKKVHALLEDPGDERSTFGSAYR